MENTIKKKKKTYATVQGNVYIGHGGLIGFPTWDDGVPVSIYCHDCLIDSLKETDKKLKQENRM